MSGAYRRAIVLRARDGVATSDIEDDFHRFAVTVEHADGVVTDVRGDALRFPWTGCALAGSALGALKGFAVTADPAAVYAFADPRGQCTHMFEMAGLAVNQAARGGERRYDAFVTDDEDGVRIAELRRDGELVLAWRLENGVIAAPSPHAGMKPSDFRSKAMGQFLHEEAEAILILRRAVSASLGRSMDIDAIPNAAAVGRGAACFVYRAGIAETALRMRGSNHDFTEAAPPLAAFKGTTP